MIAVFLPMPPSTNALWRAVRGRVIKSKAYRAWIDEAGWSLKAQKPQPVHGPVELSYAFKDGCRADLGNLEKAATDLLVTHKLIDGDGPKVVRAISLRWSSEVEGARLVVERAL